MAKHAPITYQPRLLGVAEAAAYLCVSVTKLRELPIPRRALDGRRLYDRIDLDQYASALPYEGEISEVSECDSLFGVRG